MERSGWRWVHVFLKGLGSEELIAQNLESACLSGIPLQISDIEPLPLELVVAWLVKLFRDR